MKMRGRLIAVGEWDGDREGRIFDTTGGETGWSALVFVPSHESPTPESDILAMSNNEVTIEIEESS